MQDAIVIKPFVADQVKNAMIHGRVIFFSAPCGFGKTTTAWALLEGKKVYFTAAGEPGFRLPLLREMWDVLLLDQLQNLPEEEQKPLCELIRRSPNRRFFLLSRGTPPGWLIHFQFSGLMLVLDARALLFDRDSTAKLLRLMGGDPTDLEVTAIQRESLGYPLAVAMIGREMANGSPYSPEIDAKVRRELYIHYETAVYRRFDLPIRPLPPGDLTLYDLRHRAGPDGHRRQRGGGSHRLAPAQHVDASVRRHPALPLLGYFPQLSAMGDGPGIHPGETAGHL